MGLVLKDMFEKLFRKSEKWAKDDSGLTQIYRAGAGVTQTKKGEIF